MTCSTHHEAGCVRQAEYVETKNHTGRSVWVTRVSWSKCGKFVSDQVDPNMASEGNFPEPTYNWAEVVASGLGIRRKDGVS